MGSRVLLLQLDGKLPNLALMRIAAHHRQRGDEVVLRRADHSSRVAPHLGDDFDKVYASAIFTKSLDVVAEVRHQWPEAVIGGTGCDPTHKLSHFGIDDSGPVDYSDYPQYPHSIGFSQRGCRLKCSFCVVPSKEGTVREEKTIAEIWRGDSHPRNICLLDNDFFGQPNWRDRVSEIVSGGFRVSFNQGINARMLTDEAAAAVASVQYFDDDFKVRRVYTAWDSRKDEKRLFNGLGALVRCGVQPDQIMVYMLCGYWPGETHEDRDYRRQRLRDFGARPYPMPYVRTPELVGFQRWVVRRADLKMSWAEYSGANYRPEDVRRELPTFPILEALDAR